MVPLYTDEVLGIVMKPAGLLVHRSEVAPNAEAFALQQARDLFGRRVYAAHRLDRGTSGVLIFPLIRKRRQPLPVSLRPGS